MIGVKDSLHEESGHDMRYLADQSYKRSKWRTVKFSVALLDRILLIVIAVTVIICLYLDWIKLYNGGSLYGRYALFEVFGILDTDMIRDDFETIAVLLRVVIIATTIFWAFFIWRIVLYSTERLKFFANLAGVMTVLLVAGISIAVSVINNWNFKTINLPSGSLLRLSIAPFVAAICSIAVMLLVSLRHRNRMKWQEEGINNNNSLREEDMEVVINPEADYRLMYHGSHSVGFVADMGDVMTKNVSADVTECVRRSISEEVRVCVVCGEFIRHRVSTCTNCGSKIPGE
jgi:magnesium-transporting ATPase (P-type)